MNRLDKHNAQKAAKSLRKPSWWTDSLEASWTRAKRETIADWEKIVGAGEKLEHDLAEQAFALGHGSREVYGRLKEWGGELEATLRTDWNNAGHDADRSWEQVSAAVKHGWERAVQVLTTATASNASAAIDVVDATAMTAAQTRRLRSASRGKA